MKMLTSLALSYGFFGLSSQLMAIVPPSTLMCPTVYQPARCSYEEYAAEGSNRCFALNALKQTLALHAIAVKPELIRCESTDVAFAAESDTSAAESAATTTLRNPAINLVPCVYSKLDPEGPFERPGLCRTDLRNLLIHVRASPCDDGNVRHCEQWIRQRASRIERTCESESFEIAAAVMSCLNIHSMD